MSNQVVSMVGLIMVVFGFKFNLVKLFKQEEVIHRLEDSILMVKLLLLMELLGLLLLSMEHIGRVMHIGQVMHIRRVMHIRLVEHMKLIRWVNCIRVGLIKLKLVIGRPKNIIFLLLPIILMVISERFISRLDNILLFLNIYQLVHILEGNKKYLK